MDRNPLLLVAVCGPQLSPEESAVIGACQPGGVVMAGAALNDVVQARRLTDEIRALCDLEPLIVLKGDAKGIWPPGLLQVAPPTPQSLRDRGDPKLIMTAGWITGRLCRLVGVNAHLSTDLQIGRWGADDQEVINNAGTFNRFQRKQGILCGGFPFPGGRACADHDIPGLLRSPLLPFTALMPELDLILVDHGEFGRIDPANPASRSRIIITRLLRDQLGYQRLVLCEGDDGASIAAGADLLMLPDTGSLPGTLATMAGLSGYQLSDAADRIEYARKRVQLPIRLDDKTRADLEHDARDLVERL